MRLMRPFGPLPTRHDRPRIGCFSRGLFGRSIGGSAAAKETAWPAAGPQRPGVAQEGGRRAPGAWQSSSLSWLAKTLPAPLNEHDENQLPKSQTAQGLRIHLHISNQPPKIPWRARSPEDHHAAESRLVPMLKPSYSADLANPCISPTPRSCG